MDAEQHLFNVFRLCEDAARQVRVFFNDGDAFELHIISTMHAGEGGDVVANVIRNISPRGPRLTWEGSAMNFALRGVTRVESDDECLFSIRATEPSG